MTRSIRPPVVAVTGRFALREAVRLPALLGTAWQVAAVPPEDPRQVALIGQARALVATRFDASVPVGPDLELIQSPVAGYDHVDLTAVPSQASFCNVREHEGAVAEYVLAAMLEWVIGLRRLDAGLRSGDWSGGVVAAGAHHRELAGATLGMIGLGHIAAAVAQRAAAFDMRVLAASRRPQARTAGVAEVLDFGDIDRLLDQSDFVLVCCALDAATHGLIDAQRLARMKPDAVLINIARAAIVDEAALFTALRERRIGGAVVDVWSDEAGLGDAAAPTGALLFRELDNILMTPHAASWTTAVVERRWRAVAANLDRLVRGEPLANVVQGPPAPEVG